MTGEPIATSRALHSPVERSGDFTVFLSGKPISVELTRRARSAADNLQSGRVVEMELFFSCLLRKRLLFHDRDAAPGSILERPDIHPNLTLQFRPIVAEVCRIDNLEGAPPVKTMPAQRADAFVPKWLKIDYRSGDWVGEFGY